MKKLFSAIIAILLISTVLVSINQLSGKNNESVKMPATTNPDPDEFIIGAYSIGCASQNRLQELGFNMWHRFLDQEVITGTGYKQTVFPKGFASNDGLFKAIGEYQGDVTNYYNNVSQLNNNYIYLTRPKIEMLTFAQRSDYHPLPLALRQPSPTGEKWWYGYNTHQTGTPVPDNGKQVIKCTIGQGAGYVVKDLRPTWEQVKGEVPNNFFADSIYSWYVKPSVKIPANTPPGTPIFRIDILKKDGFLLKSVEVNRNSFDLGGNYSGGYIDEFDLGVPSPLFIYNGADLYGTPSNPNDSKVDYAIYWYGNCDMWLERVRVENDWAYRLFKDQYLQSGNEWLTWEVQNIARNIPKSYKFLVDESEYNMYPAIGYLNHIIDSLNTAGTKISTIALNNIAYWIPEQRDFWNGNIGHVWTDTMLVPDIQSNFQKSGMNEVFTDVYPLYANVVNGIYYRRPSYVPGTLTYSDYNIGAGRLGVSAAPQAYEDNFNANIDEIGHHYIDFNQKANMLSRTYNVPYITAIQIHSWYNGADNLYSLREPTNEEIEVLAGIALTYGSKGIIYHAYNSIGNLGEANVYSRGLVGDLYNTISSQCDDGKRLHNAYKQEKWQKIIDLTAKLKILGKDIIKFDNTKSFGYRLHNSVERAALFQNTYFNNITPFKYGSGAPPCNETDNIPAGMTYDCPDESYVQVGTFKSKTNEPYFMFVNRRASPVSTGNYDGRRFMRIILDANSPEFANFNNWKIIDVESNTAKAAFDKRQINTIDFDWLMPGEIKLYKFSPVMVEGGTLQGDENVTGGLTFNCKGMVYNNAKNITINTGTTINFMQNAGIEMDSGIFSSGASQEIAPPHIVFQGLNNALWKGIQLQNCTSVNVSYTDFKNIEYNAESASHNNALNIINSANYFISKCNFELDTKAGGVNMMFNFGNVKWFDYMVSYNNFTIPQGNTNEPLPQPFGITCTGTGNMPIRIDGNIFSNSSLNAAPLAITLTGVTGGSVKNNTITNFLCSVNSSSSSIDFYGNTIYNNGTNSTGLYGNGGGAMYLSPNYTNYTGGANNISTLGSNGINLKAENTYFYTDYGYNTFNISTPGTNNLYHYYGYFPLKSSSQQYARNNCYQENSTAVTTPTNIVTAGYGGTQINFIFNPRTCEPNGGGEDYIVYSSPGVQNDTVAVRYNGNGGGMNENGKSMDAVQSDYRKLLDSMNINLRKRLYSVVETQAYNLLNQYIDSTESLDAIAKLYLVTTVLDSAGNKMNPLKSYLENIIANNPGNTGLLSRTFYFIQKCKVSLKQYSSAMQGFQLIIQQNPYSYEGLVASWDYASTHLLDSLYGHGGGYSSKAETGEEMMETEQVLTNMFFENYDSTKFSKKQRTDMVKSINDVMESKRITQTEKVIQLQKKSDAGNTDARRELKTMKVLNETIKKKTPGTVIELSHIIQGDVKKIFHVESKDDGKKIDLIPKTFELYQNYPNPFNPVTKIAFDMPQDGKVKLMIYDILGREIKTLVNNDFRSAGKYIMEFDGNNLASGIYFYRIQVSGAREFTAVKKMVLVK